MRKLSKKRARQNREYLKVRDEYLYTHPFCEVKNCQCWATEIHHKKGRVGKLLTDKQYFMAVCRSHHNYIENHPVEAKAHGYSLSRLSNEQTI